MTRSDAAVSSARVLGGSEPQARTGTPSASRSPRPFLPPLLLTAVRSMSPTSWPSVSLTYLKSSRSTSIRERGRSYRLALTSSIVRCSSKARRLYRPVRASRERRRTTGSMKGGRRPSRPGWAHSGSGRGRPASRPLCPSMASRRLALPTRTQERRRTADVAGAATLVSDFHQLLRQPPSKWILAWRDAGAEDRNLAGG